MLAQLWHHETSLVWRRCHASPNRSARPDLLLGDYAIMTANIIENIIKNGALASCGFVLANGGQHDGEGRSPSNFGFDVEFSPVSVEDMLDNRQTKAGAALFPTSRSVDAIKPFRQARQVLPRYPRTIVPDGDFDTVAAGEG